MPFSAAKVNLNAKKSMAASNFSNTDATTYAGTTKVGGTG
jgi:hypothetical protein